MKLIVFSLLLGLLLSALTAGEKRYKKLLEYENVTVREVKKDGIRIMHNAGLATIPIEKLPEEVRKELGMTMDGVKEYRKKVATQKNAQAKLQREAYLRELKRKKEIAAAEKKRFYIIQANAGGGMLVDTMYKQDTTRHSSARRNGGGSGIVLSSYRWERSRKVYFMKGNDRTYADGEAFDAYVIPAGLHTYTNAGGAQSTVKCFKFIKLVPKRR